MATKLSLVIAGLSIAAAGCVKNSTKDTRPIIPPVISQARAYFETKIQRSGLDKNPGNYRANQPKWIRWENATIKHLPIGDIVMAPVAYQNNLIVSLKSAPSQAYYLSDLTSLAMIPDSNQVLHAVLITFFPDTTSTNTSPEGICLVEDWEGNSIYSPIKIGDPLKHHNPNLPVSSRRKEVTFFQDIEVCTEIDGYNYSSGLTNSRDLMCLSFDLNAHIFHA